MVVVEDGVAQTGQGAFDTRRFGRLNPADIQKMHQGTEALQGRCFQAKAGKQHLEGHSGADMGESCAIEVKTQGIGRAIRRGHQPKQLGLRVDAAANQPGTGQPVHPRALTRCPDAPAIIDKIQPANRFVDGAWLIRGKRPSGTLFDITQGFIGLFLCFAREEVAGNPVRAQIAAIAPPEQRLAGREGALRLLVLGGSQGARALNEAVPVALAKLGGAAVEVRHQCGEKLRAEAERAYADAGVQARVEAFIDDMAAAYAWADLVVCRAGASTLAELCAVGIGSVLVPFAAAVDDHQTRNAEYLVDNGAALLLRQDAQLAANLQPLLRDLLADPDRRLAMARAARALARPDAAARIAEVVLEESLPSDKSPGVSA